MLSREWNTYKKLSQEMELVFITDSRIGVASEKYASGVEWEEDESTIISEHVRAW
jgi:hypothetical protein